MTNEIQVRFLTLNIFLRPPLIKSNASDHKNGRTKYFIENIMHYYDVICLQEVFRKWNSRCSKLIARANDMGLVYSIKSPWPHNSKHLIDGGLLILSRFEIVDYEFVPYTQAVFPDKLSYKGILYARLKVGSSFVNVITSHLQSSFPCGDPLKFLLYRHIRRTQLVQIRDFLDSKIPSSECCIIAGDLNIDGREAQKPPLFEEVPAQDDYEHMVGILSRLGSLPLVDLIRARYGYSLPTYGKTDITGVPLETVLTLPVETAVNQTLDYLLIVGAISEDFSVNYGETGVVSFKVHGKKFTQVSDHAGLHFTFSIAAVGEN